MKMNKNQAIKRIDEIEMEINLARSRQYFIEVGKLEAEKKAIIKDYPGLSFLGIPGLGMLAGGLFKFKGEKSDCKFATEDVCKILIGRSAETKGSSKTDSCNKR